MTAKHDDDFVMPSRSRTTLPFDLLSIFEDEEIKPRERLSAAKLLVSMDRNNIAREAVRSRADRIVDLDLRNEAIGETRSAAELRRDPEYLRWMRERAVAADSGEPGSLGVARIVGVGTASGGD